ncbi:MAG: ubiquitin-like domain-containing protein [Anaerolineae bacterium]
MKRKLLFNGLLIGAIALFLVGLALIYRTTQRVVNIDINGIAYQYRTHQRTAESVLREIRLQLRPEDRVELPDAEALAQGEPIRIVLARTIIVLHDGYADKIHLIARSVSDVLGRAQVSIGIHDEVLIAHRAVELHDSLPQLKVPENPTLKQIQAALALPVQISVQRAILINVTDGTLPSSFYTTADTVGQALYENGIWIFEGDKIMPALDERVSPEMSIVIERSKPVILDSGGNVRQIRTRLNTVGDLLQEQKVETSAKDYITPDPRTLISTDLQIKVVRVRDEYQVTDAAIPYRTLWQPDASLELDSRAEIPGQEGIIRTRVRVRYENDVPVYQSEEEVWVAREPQDHIYKYGTNIVLRTLDTPSGQITYWRKIHVLLTSYSPSDAGTPFNSPWFGYTYLGLKATKGIVAVDPGVIDLGTWMYVPGYGKAYAADTGGMIRGKHVDLCYDDYNYINWYQYGDIYLLAPVPYNVDPILPGEGPPADVDNG